MTDPTRLTVTDPHAATRDDPAVPQPPQSNGQRPPGPGDPDYRPPDDADASPPVSVQEGQPTRHQLTDGPDDPAPDQQPTTWTPIDPTPYLDGTYTPPPPTQLQRTDGLHLLYGGRVNLLFGESEVGKGWVALHAVAQAINRGDPVLYIDLEDYPDTIYGRLLALGCTPDQLTDQLAYIRPDSALDTPARHQLHATITDLDPALAVIDGMTGAMRLLGLDDNRGTEVDGFYATLPEPLAATGTAVVLIDHVPKSTDNRGKGPIGSQHKRARVSGAAYRVEVVRHLAPGRAGHLKLTVDKDRLGAIRREHPTRAGDFHLDATTDQLHAELRAPDVPTDDAGTFRPTVLMQRVSMALEGNLLGLSQKAITDEVEGRAEYIRKALNTLIDEGYVEREPGPRRSWIHRSAKPFRDTETTSSDPTTSSRTSSSSSDLVPGTGRSPGRGPSPTSSRSSDPPYYVGGRDEVDGRANRTTPPVDATSTDYETPI